MSEGQGFLTGVVVVLMVWAVCLLMSKAEKKSCSYDERQLLMRGKGFQYGFFTLMIYNMVYGAAYMDEMPSWCDNMTGNFIGIALALLVFGTYCIWNDAYVSLNQNPKRVYILSSICAIVNLLVGIFNICDEEMIVDGRITFHSVNILLAVVFAVFIVVFGLKNYRDSRETE